MGSPKQLLFVGASRQTLGLMRRLKQRLKDQVNCCLIHHHSFWIDEIQARAIIGGQLGLNDIRVDLTAYVQAVNGQLITDQVTSLLPRQQKIMTAAGRLIYYDAVVFDENFYGQGSGQDVPAFGHFYIRPSYDILEIKNEIETLIETVDNDKLKFLVLGGGETGVTYALHLESLLRTRLGPKGWSIAIIEEQSCLLPKLTQAASTLAARFCKMSDIQLILDTKVEHVQSHRVVLSKGKTRFFDLAIRTYPDFESKLFYKSDVPTDNLGRILVNTGFQATSHEEIFALGDTGRLESDWQPVISYQRQERVVEKNLIAVINGKPIKHYPLFKPISRLLPLGGNYGMLVRGKRVIYGRWCLNLINWYYGRTVKKLQTVARKAAHV